jgi:hypothetical protein
MQIKKPQEHSGGMQSAADEDTTSGSHFLLIAYLKFAIHCHVKRSQLQT